MNTDASSLINQASYPLQHPSSAAYGDLLMRCRTQYQTQGYCLLADFIPPQPLAQMQQQAAACLPQAYFSESKHSVYLTDNAPDYQKVVTRVGSIPYDRIGTQSLLARLYRDESLLEFIRAVLGKSQLFHLADPLGACSINVFTDGAEHGWHYDEAEFTVTLLLQKPEHGGSFDFVPMVRDTADEHQQIEAAIAGQSDGVVELPFTEGTLLIFGGRQTLHRVSQVGGTTPRLVPVLCYSEQPGVQNSAAVRKMFWGREGAL